MDTNQVISIFLLTSTSLISSCGAGSFVGSAAKSGSKKTSTIIVDEGGEICNKTRPVIGDVKPVEKWHWSGWTPAGGKKHGTTYSSPVVGDLDNDGKTEVVTVPSTADNYSTSHGPVVVLEGTSGRPLFNSIEVLGSAGGAMVSSTPMLADLDKDGFAEIIFTAFVTPSTVAYGTGADAAANAAIKVLAIDYKTRAIKYTFQNANLTCGSVANGIERLYCLGAVADIDGDGSLEVVIGNAILSNTLTLKKLFSVGTGYSMPSTVSLADVSPASPGLEIVANGSRVFSSQGVLLWSGGAACEGYSAVSDINNDGSNEVICVGGGKVTAFSNSGSQIWQSAVPIKSNVATMGGPPNVGNFLGDDKFEIGLAGGHYYVVFDHTGKEVWKQETQDFSSHRTGSTIFDFNGDGKMEVVYNDEQKLRIYAGETGTVLWETDNPSGTLWEYPLVANVDDDISSELIVSSPTRGGVRVFEDPKNLWMYSRRVWNQYSYFPELVDDLLKTTPIFSQKVRHGFRVNSQGLNPPVKNPCQK
jgi:hypothetical protein